MTDHMKGTAMAPRTAPLSAWAATSDTINLEGGYSPLLHDDEVGVY